MFQKIQYEFVLDTSRRNQRHESEVMLHCTQGKKFVDIPTSVFCMKPQFEDGKINDTHPMHDGLNAMLTQVLTDVEKTEIEAFRKDIQCSVQTIYSIYVDHLNTTLPLIDFCAAVMKFSPQRKPVTKKKYDYITKVINDFSPGISLEDIDLNFLKKFEKDCYERGNAESTVWSNMKCIRALFNEAIKRDLLKPWQTPFKLYEIPEHRSRTDVLRWPEVEQMMTFEFKGNDRRFNNIRDIFCFACMTGLRASDLIHLTSDKIQTVGDVTWLRMHTQKTGTFIQIPLSVTFYGLPMDILRKYGSIEEMIQYKEVSGMNKAIKHMVKIVGVGGGQRISMHTGRRSCATALADFGVSILTIQKYLGHQRITTTQAYIRLSTQTVENELRNIFKRDTMKDQHEVVYVRANGQKLYADSEFLRCAHCSFFTGGKQGLDNRCHLFKKKTHVYDWCRNFSERLL